MKNLMYTHNIHCLLFIVSKGSRKVFSCRCLTGHNRYCDLMTAVNHLPNGCTCTKHFIIRVRHYK